MTVITRQSAFIYGLTESLAETALPVALATARYAVIGWDWYYGAFFSAKAQHVYTTLGEALGHLMIFTVLMGRIARKHFQSWVDAEVAAALPADHFVDANKMVEPDPFAPEMNPAYATVPAAMAPVATLVVPVSRNVEDMTLAQLRKLALAHNRGLAKDDPRRIANAARLTKAQALAVLG